MGKTVRQLFAQEKRDPISIKIWLKKEGISDECIDLAIAEHAQILANGGSYGYENGISVLSNSIRDRARQLMVADVGDTIDKLGKFTAQERLSKRVWKFLNAPL